MKKLVVALMVLGVFIIASPILSGSGHCHDHNHGFSCLYDYKGRQDCYECSGSGKCHHCYYRYYYNYYGSGECADCEGSGNCSECFGSGILELYHDDDGDEHIEYCYKCDGLGRCSTCEGSGKCTFCNGSGNCSVCDGSGFTYNY